MIYLLGVIPSMDQWSIQVDYEKELEKIKKKGLDDVELSQADIDIAKMQGDDINRMKISRLKSFKKQQLEALNEKYGIENPKKQQKEPEGLPSMTEEVSERQKQAKIWEMLNGKTLKKETPDGL